MGLSRDQADTFLVNQDPTGLIRSLWRSGFLVSKAPGPGSLQPCSSLRLLPPLPGPPAPTWVALGGAGLQDPEPCLCGRLVALPPPGSHPPGSTGQVSPRLPYKAGAGRSLVGLVLCRL